MRRFHRRFLIIIFLVILVAVGLVTVYYNTNLQPVSHNSAKQNVTIVSGLGVNQIATLLKQNHLIRSTQVFEWYIDIHNERDKLQAGTYSFSPAESTPTIAKAIASGKIATNLVTILPGQTLGQIMQTFVKGGFSAAAVNAGFNPNIYSSKIYPVLATKPAGASLEGLLWPDSFQKSANTNPSQIVAESLAEMDQHLTANVSSRLASEGLSVYQGIILASIVEKEVSSQTDRNQVAQVFLKRLQIGMPLGSDVTAYYGSYLAGLPPSLSYDSAYNTLIHTGLPPGPIGTISSGSLYAVSHPAGTNWLYFVSGDNGTTYFSQTLQQQNVNTRAYCHKLCSQ